MIFTEGIFLVFFAIVFTLHWSVTGRSARHIILLIASCIFYGWWDWRFLGLFWLVIIIAWAVPLLSQRLNHKQWPLTAGITLCLAILGYFKYANFFIGSLQSAAQSLHITLSTPTLQVILPIGISFYIFHAISYMIDVRRGHVQLERSLIRVALYIAFFPQLVAGPIVRARDFIPQFNEDKTLTNDDIVAGTRAILIGFLYKALFADTLALFVDPVFNDPQSHSAHARVMATFGFYSQIYFDFAGYSLMAIGVARFFGYRLPENFRFPYLATSIVDFWRRWHMSLSFWLRDYLYIPLGGSRFGTFRRYLNLMITMLLGGLWHGASWAFVLWGGLHGAALAINHATHDIFKTAAARSILALALGWLATQALVLFAWVPFRAADLPAALSVYSAFLTPLDKAGTTAIKIPYLLIFGPILVDSLIHAPLAMGTPFAKIPAPVYWVAIGALFGLALQLLPLNVAPFIYFQF